VVATGMSGLAAAARGSSMSPAAVNPTPTAVAAKSTQTATRPHALLISDSVATVGLTPR
jgi:hypothetical protein